MDLYCPTCGEPLDSEELHEAAKLSGREFGEVFADFRKDGCKALEKAGYGNSDCRPNKFPREAEAARIVYESGVFDDDVDAAAGSIEDLLMIMGDD